MVAKKSKKSFKKRFIAWASTPDGMKKFMNWWPPNRYSGVRWTDVADDFSYGRVELRLRWWNMNAHGKAYGGTLYAFGDALVGSLIARRLGEEYEAWTRTGSFQYISPGKDGCYLEITYDDEFTKWVHDTIEEDGYCNAPISVPVYNVDGSVVGIFQQDIHVRKKGGKRADQPKQARFPRGFVLTSLATALVWHAFHDKPEKLTVYMSAQRRMADPREQISHAIEKSLEDGLTRQQILDFGIPEEFLPEQAS